MKTIENSENYFTQNITKKSYFEETQKFNVLCPWKFLLEKLFDVRCMEADVNYVCSDLCNCGEKEVMSNAVINAINEKQVVSKYRIVEESDTVFPPISAALY